MLNFLILLKMYKGVCILWNIYYYKMRKIWVEIWVYKILYLVNDGLREVEDEVVGSNIDFFNLVCSMLGWIGLVFCFFFIFWNICNVFDIFILLLLNRIFLYNYFF